MHSELKKCRVPNSHHTEYFGVSSSHYGNIPLVFSIDHDTTVEPLLSDPLEGVTIRSDNRKVG